MPLWDKLRVELNRAGKAAQDALDEGKVRLEEFRARQRADRAAQVLGYAVYRARKAGAEVEPEVYARLSSELAAAEAEAEAHAESLRRAESQTRSHTSPGEPPGATGSAGGTTEPPSPSGPTPA